MVHLIDKDALVAEIERLCDEKGTFYADDVLWNLKEYLNTLEVKEVDLEKEIAFQWEGCDCDDINLYAKVSNEQFKAIAKHFFKLGLKAKEGMYD